MTTRISHADLVETIAAALQFISYYHPADYISHLARAYEREASPAAKDAIAQILTNSRMCAEGHRPICQDTGIVNVFLKIGMDVRWEGFDGSIEDAINEGVRRGYNHPDNTLRGNVAADIVGHGYWLAFPQTTLGVNNKVKLNAYVDDKGATVGARPDRMPFGVLKTTPRIVSKTTACSLTPYRPMLEM